MDKKKLERFKVDELRKMVTTKCKVICPNPKMLKKAALVQHLVDN